MDLDLMAVADFLVLLEEGHFGKAATRQHLSGSALSKRIQRLEHQVGVPLVLRNASGVVGPTSAGTRFARDAVPLLAAARAARDAARSAVAPCPVRLGIVAGIDPGIARALVAEARRLLQERCPGVGLVGLFQPIPAVHGSVIDGVVDVMLGVVGKTPSGVESAPVAALDRLVVLSARHALAEAGRATADDVVDRPLLFDPAVPSGWMDPFLLGDVRPAREARVVEVGVRGTSLAPAEAMLRGGDAVTVALPSSARTLGRGLRALPVAGLPPVTMQTSRRREERREPVLAVQQIVTEVAQSRMRGL
jgi:DNA-binding transcriptional LysR family regulator